MKSAVNSSGRMAGIKASQADISSDVFHVFYPALINLIYSISAFVMTMLLIPTTRDYFMKAGLKGKDMAKKDKKEM